MIPCSKPNVGIVVRHMSTRNLYWHNSASIAVSFYNLEPFVLFISSLSVVVIVPRSSITIDPDPSSNIQQSIHCHIFCRSRYITSRSYLFSEFSIGYILLNTSYSYQIYEVRLIIGSI